MTIGVTREGRKTGSKADLGTVNLAVEYGNVQLFFSDERGLGDSLFQVYVKPESFAVLARAMMHADAEQAIKAFGAALTPGTPEKRDVWVPTMGG